MGKKAVFLESTGEIKISKETAPEFLLLYQQSVLLALKEEGVLNEAQYGFSLETLFSQYQGFDFFC